MTDFDIKLHEYSRSAYLSTHVSKNPDISAYTHAPETHDLRRQYANEVMKKTLFL